MAATNRAMAEPVTPETGTKTEAILSAAVKLFPQFGFRRTSMDDIAREAGVAKGTLYLYFAGKAEVFRAMQQRNFEDAEARCEAAEAEGGSFRDRLARVLEANYGWFHTHYGASEHLSELGLTRVTVGADIAARSEQVYARRLERMFEAAALAGEISLAAGDLPAEDLTATVLSAARGAKLASGQPVSPETYRQSLSRIAAMAAAAVRP